MNFLISIQGIASPRKVSLVPSAGAPSALVETNTAEIAASTTQKSTGESTKPINIPAPQKDPSDKYSDGVTGTPPVTTPLVEKLKAAETTTPSSTTSQPQPVKSTVPPPKPFFSNTPPATYRPIVEQPPRRSTAPTPVADPSLVPTSTADVKPLTTIERKIDSINPSESKNQATSSTSVPSMAAKPNPASISWVNFKAKSVEGHASADPKELTFMVGDTITVRLNPVYFCFQNKLFPLNSYR